ncbi:MAG TPA: fasciclin domain-containing protein [Planktothrix sp.]|jgi:uncharacterized surface protein with fasciclin (FAS1) repeats
MSKRTFGVYLMAPVVLVSLFAYAPSCRAEHTKSWGQKEGFHRDTKDILNTLKNNEVTQFQSFLDALQQGFGMDIVLKDKGPFTVFAPSDSAFQHMNSDDFKALMANQKKLKEVVSYLIVKGEVKSDKLATEKSVTTLGGGQIKLSKRGDDLYANDVLITMTDIPCTNGVIHVINRVMFPPAAH